MAGNICWVNTSEMRLWVLQQCQGLASCIVRCDYFCEAQLHPQEDVGQTHNTILGAFKETERAGCSYELVSL